MVKIGKLVHPRLQYHVEDRVYGQIENQVSEVVKDQVWRQVTERVGDSTCFPLHHPVWRRIRVQMGEAVINSGEEHGRA